MLRCNIQFCVNIRDVISLAQRLRATYCIRRLPSAASARNTHISHDYLVVLQDAVRLAQVRQGVWAGEALLPLAQAREEKIKAGREEVNEAN
jgi:hypothetical protein